MCVCVCVCVGVGVEGERPVYEQLKDSLDECNQEFIIVINS